MIGIERKNNVKHVGYCVTCRWQVKKKIEQPVIGLVTGSLGV